MNRMDKFVIFLAKKSLAINNKNRVTSRLCRMAYQGMSKVYCAVSSKHIRLQNLAITDVVNTYPWPYREKWFSDEDYRDPVGFPPKTSESYCAWKYSEATGYNFRKPINALGRTARYWRVFLKENGCYRRVERPEPGKYFVGISLSFGETGEVVWFEGFDDGQDVEKEIDTNGEIIFSTYRNKKYFRGAALADWFIWIEVSARGSEPSYGDAV